MHSHQSRVFAVAHINNAKKEIEEALQANVRNYRANKLRITTQQEDRLKTTLQIFAEITAEVDAAENNA